MWLHSTFPFAQIIISVDVPVLALCPVVSVLVFHSQNDNGTLHDDFPPEQQLLSPYNFHIAS